MDDEISVTVIATGFKVVNIGPAKPIGQVYDQIKMKKRRTKCELSSEEIKTVDSINEPQGTLNFNNEEESTILNIKLEKFMRMPKTFN